MIFIVFYEEYSDIQSSENDWNWFVSHFPCPMSRFFPDTDRCRCLEGGECALSRMCLVTWKLNSWKIRLFIAPNNYGSKRNSRNHNPCPFVRLSFLFKFDYLELSICTFDLKPNKIIWGRRWYFQNIFSHFIKCLWNIKHIDQIQGAKAFNYIDPAPELGSKVGPE